MANAQRALVLILGTAEWNAPIATNQHYVARELAREFDVMFCEGVGTRRPTLSPNDLKRMTKRLRSLVAKSSGDPSAESMPTRKVPDNVEVLSPFVLPLHTGPTQRVNAPLLERAVNRWLTHDGPKVLWSFTPFTYGLEKHADFSVYHLVDLLHENPNASRTDIFRGERELARNTNVAIATSEPIGEHLRESGFETVLVRNNVADVEVFEAARGTAKEQPPVALFVGNMRADKLDVELLTDLARAMSSAGATLRLIGPSGLEPGERSFIDDLRGLGVDVKPAVGLDQLAIEAARSAVGLVPYRVNALTRGVSPLKTYEYLAAGVPVVSTALPSMKSVVNNDVAVCDSRDDFVAAVMKIVERASAGDFADAKANIDCSWRVRGAEYRDLVTAGLG